MIELSRAPLAGLGVSLLLAGLAGCSSSREAPEPFQGIDAPGMGSASGSGGDESGGSANGGGGTRSGGGTSSGGGSSNGGTSSGGDSNGGSGGSEPVECPDPIDTETYDYSLNVPPSQDPPGGLSPSEVPQLVSIGWDDNFNEGAMTWATSLLEDRGINTTFFHQTIHVTDVGDEWVVAHDAGNETALHTVNHQSGTNFTLEMWEQETDNSISMLTRSKAEGGMGISASELRGFRMPMLEYNDLLFDVLKSRDIWYDSSINEGFQPDQDGTNYYWPYTLDGGSPGHDFEQEEGMPNRQFDVTSHPGLFEMPIYALNIPPDDLAETYDFEPGLRSRVEDSTSGVSALMGHKIIGFDYNMVDPATANVTATEMLAILKYNLDLRLDGNRAPFLLGAHTHYFTSLEQHTENRAAMEDFLDYALSKPEVRVVTYKEVMDFMRNPTPLGCE